MTYFRYFILGAMLLLGGALSALAQPFSHGTIASPWHESEGGRMRLLLAISRATSPSYQGVVEIELQDGWKTYWRNPGNSGMAPYFTTQGGENVSLFYPAPQLFGNDEDWSNGYMGRVLLPFNVLIDKENTTFSGRLTVGMCKTICLPVSVDFNFNLESGLENASPSDEMVLSSAFKALPKEASKDFALIAAREALDQENMLVVTLKHPPSDILPTLFIDGGNTEIGMAKILKHQQNETVFHVPVLYAAKDWDKTFFYTAKLGAKAVFGEFKAQ